MNTTTTITEATQLPEAQHSWQWQLRHALRTERDLAAFLSASADERVAIEQCSQGLHLLIPPYYASLIDPHDPRCPIRLQCVPRSVESVRVDGDLSDPLGECCHQVAPHLIRRYPDRALLVTTAACAVHCRFCTRSRVVGVHRGLVPLNQLEPAFNWLQQHPDVSDLLLSGGDPLVASTRRIDALLTRARAVPSLGVIRIGTRVPVVLPMRIDEPLLAVLRRHQPLWIMTHFNHPKELTPQSRHAVEALADAGLPVMNQTVLLRGVNDAPEVLEALFRGLVRSRVRPYYLLHADAVGGTAHLRTKLADSIAIFGALQGRLSGIALPKLIVDTPGGKGKVPVGPPTIVAQQAGRTTLRTYRGEHVDVIDPVLPPSYED